MRNNYYIFGGIVLAIIIYVLLFFHHGETAVWDFTHSRDLSVVNWPTAQRGQSEWDSHTRQFKKITIVLPNRPPMISEHPVNVFIEQQGGKIIKIDINEEPVTQKQALDQVRDLAKRWGWWWDEAIYQAWSKRVLKNDTSRVGAGDRWPSKEIPHLSASIINSAGTPDRPWYVQLHVEWPEVLPTPS